MAAYTNMPDDVKKLATETEAAITAGKLHPFKCPVIGQDGKPVECKGGANLDDGQILSMNYFIKGDRRQAAGEVSSDPHPEEPRVSAAVRRMATNCSPSPFETPARRCATAGSSG